MARRPGRRAAGGQDAPAAAAPPAAAAVPVTHPDKLLWPADGLTKRDLVAYYQAVAAVLLPHLAGRPLVLKPYPNGISGRFYYRQTLPRTAPAWLSRWRHDPEGGGPPNLMPVADTPAALVWLANQAAIELHPWLSRIDAPDRPDYAVFDLDVLDPALFPLALRVALLLRDALAARGLRAYPTTSGGDGVHVYVPLERGPDFDQTRAWAHALAESLRAGHPDLIATDSSIAGRQQLVLIDYAQNALAKTTVAPYSVRPRPGAPVSMPLTWDEVAAGAVRPDDFTLRTAPARLAQRGDLFAPVLHGGQRLA
jgi:bifunctional non-homologous end joining protein LigD